MPTDAILWVDMFPNKALEYGDEAKVLMVFDGRRLGNTGMEVPPDVAPEELARMRRDYQTLLKKTDGEFLWLSRMPECDRRVGTGYEVSYGRWIPGYPWQVLVMIFILAHDVADPALQQVVAELLGAAERPGTSRT